MPEAGTTSATTTDAAAMHAGAARQQSRRSAVIRWLERTLPSGRDLPDEQWDRHHTFVLRTLVALSLALLGYGLVQRVDLGHLVLDLVVLAALSAVAARRALSRTWRAAAAAAGLMTGSAVAVHLSGGATEAHFLFFALLPLAALYAARAPFFLAVGFVAVHHFVVGTLSPSSVFEEQDPVLGMAALHAGFVLLESWACLVAWRRFEDRRELVERLVLERTGQLRRTEAEAVAAARQLQEQAGELTRLAMHDPLTGLANRALMQDRLEHALAPRRARHNAVLLLDLDDFKAVNDVFGHGAGDAVLTEVARRLESCVRPADTVARLGGDEFVVLMEDVDGCPDAVAVAGRLLSAMAEPVRWGSERFEIGGSVGITLSEGADGRGPGELLRDADIAMYVAKAGGKNRYEVFEPGMRDRVVAHNELVRDLRRAVIDGELRLHYQPQVDLRSGDVTGVEALARWERGERGLVSPERFIPVAESTGMIGLIDDWVLREACRQLRAWDDAGLGQLRMSVNVSARRLTTGDLAERIAEYAQEWGVDPARLELEVTETVAVGPGTGAAESIRNVRALGVHVAIDDFGMGHSSLSRLQEFPLERLKIDRSFVAPLGAGTARGSIADAMITLGHSLGLEVVAEGVEEADQMAALRELGCRTAQGFLFGRPVPPQEIEHLLRSDRPLVRPAAD
jgi:diguanylate cyclase (GGDEF)-like protein